ncbi:hypothetical protein D9M71_305960 [compost metagenome]
MVHRVDRQLVSSDLVGHVAVGGDAIGTDYDPGNALGLHQMSSSRVGIDRQRNALLGQLPGGQARALQPGPGFIDVDPLDHTLHKGCSNHPQGGAETASGQRTVVAVGQQGLLIALVLANQVDPHLRHGQVGFAVTVMDSDGFGLHDRGHILTLLDPHQALAHAIECPEQIGAGGASVDEQLEIFFQGHFPIIAFSQALANGHGKPIGSADTNGRGAAHRHRADGLGHLGSTRTGPPSLLER